jgi:hypothetical protein
VLVAAWDVVVAAMTARVVGVVVDTTTGVVDVATLIEDVGIALLVDVVFGVAAVVVEVTTATFVLPVSIETEYAETENTASVPG